MLSSAYVRRPTNNSYTFSRKWIRPLDNPSRTNSASSSLSTASLSSRIFSNDCFSLSFFFDRFLPRAFSSLCWVLGDFFLPLILLTHVGCNSMPLLIKITSHSSGSLARMIALATILLGALQLHASYSSSVIYASYRLAVASCTIGCSGMYNLDIQRFQKMVLIVVK